MTIAVGFKCSDGLLFASDTLYSGWSRNRYGPKFWEIPGWGNTTVVFGGAGSVAGLTRTRDQIARKARPTTDPDDVLHAVDEALALVEAKLQSATDWDKKVFALVGIRSESKCTLYHNDATTMLAPVTNKSQCVGAAAPLGVYFADVLFRDGMSIDWAKVVAAHLMKHVKKYCSGWTGGSTHLYEFPNQGAPQLIDNKKTIRGFEERLEAIDSAIQLVLPDKRTTQAQLDHRLTVLNDTIRHLRSGFVVSPGTGRIVYQGLPAYLQASGAVGPIEMPGNPTISLSQAEEEDPSEGGSGSI